MITEEQAVGFSTALNTLRDFRKVFSGKDQEALFFVLLKHIVYRDNTVSADKQFDFRLYKDRFEEVKDIGKFYERAYEFAEGFYIVEEYDEEKCVFCRVLTRHDKNLLKLLLQMGFSVRITIDRWEKAVKHLYNHTNDTGFATVKAFACL